MARGFYTLGVWEGFVFIVLGRLFFLGAIGARGHKKPGRD